MNCRRLFVHCIAPITLVLVTSSLSSASLIISEYIEGSSFNKAIELFNTSASAVDLTAGGWTLELYSNGSPTVSQSMSLSGMINALATFVISHASADAAILAEANATNSAVINFNGDDAIVLKKSGVVIDSIGQVGFDPGSNWAVGTASTSDKTLVRKPSIVSGDTNVGDSYDPSLEWEVHPNNTFSNLGTHAFSPPAVVPEPVSLVVWGGVGLIGIGVAIYRKKVA